METFWEFRNRKNERNHWKIKKNYKKKMIDNFVKLVTLLNDMYSISRIHLASNCLISLFAVPYSPF